VARRTELKDKPVTVRGKVVKFTGGVMGKNWIHLRDGSGSSAENTNDIVVTTTDETQIGDVVVAKGVVRTDVNLGSGYSYAVLVDDAKLQK
ncbi:MAG TPA: nucleotide-binding protein, partial [Burkholderiales bacterium]|nr:nucleotide-binding protein [Burkholderiales bacterium]